MNLEELLDNYYAPKKGNDLLVKLIESKMNSLLYLAEDSTEAQDNTKSTESDIFKGEKGRYIQFPRIMISKNLGIKKDYSREFLDTVVDNIKEKTAADGDLIANRIQKIQKFMTDPVTPSVSVSEIMSYSMIVETFYHLINDYDATTSGDLLEGIFAGLFDGSIVQPPPDESGVKSSARNFAAEDVLIEGMAISLKLKKDGETLDQNFINVLKSIKQYGSLIYIVGYKTENKINFYELELNGSNIWPTEKAKSPISNFTQLVAGYDYSNDRNIDNLLAYLEGAEKNADVASKEYKIQKKEYDLKRQEYEKKISDYKQLRSAALGANKADPEYLKRLLADLPEEPKAPTEPQKFKTKMYISSSAVKPNPIGTIYYSKEDLYKKLEAYVNQINTYIKIIYDNLTALNISIDNFFLKKDRNVYATKAITSAREVENNLRQQFQQETGKKFVLRK